MTRTVLTLVTVVAFTACTTLKPMADLSPAAMAGSLRAGDIVEVRTGEGGPLVLTVTRVGDDGLTGATADGVEQTIPLGSLAAVNRRELSGARTTGLVAAIVVALLLLVGDDSVVGGGSGSNDDNY